MHILLKFLLFCAITETTKRSFRQTFLNIRLTMRTLLKFLYYLPVAFAVYVILFYIVSYLVFQMPAIKDKNFLTTLANAYNTNHESRNHIAVVHLSGLLTGTLFYGILKKKYKGRIACLITCAIMLDLVLLFW